MIKYLNEFRLEKQGEITPRALIENLLENINRIDRIVVSVKCKDEEILTAFTTGSALENIGLLEASKVDLLQTLIEEK